MISILYVDDEPDLLELAKIFLEQSGEFCVRTSISAEGVLGDQEILSFDAILSDYQMPGMDGIAFLKEIRKRSPDLPFILFTGRGREEVVIEALNNGADFYIQKGGDPKAQFAELANKIRYAVNRKRAERELQKKSDELNASYEQIAANEEELRQQLDELTAKQEALKISEEKFRAFTENVPDLTTISDVNGNYLYISPSIQRITGQKADVLQGKRYAGVSSFFGIVPEDTEIILASGRSAMKKPGMPVTVPPFRVRDVQGQCAFIEGTITYLPDVKGIQGLLFHGRNITDRVNAEEEIDRKNRELRLSYEQLAASEEELRGQYEELAFGEKRIRDSEEKFRTLFDKIHEALIIYSGRKFLDCNQRALELFGYMSKEEFLTLVPKDIFPPHQPDGQDSVLSGEAHLRKTLQEGSDHFEWVHKRKDGSLFPADVLLSLFELDGKRMVLASIRDISERKQRDDELRLLKISVDRSSDEVFWLDFDGSIRYVNDAACTATGYTRDELCSMKLFELDPDFPQEVWDTSVADLKKKKTQSITTRHKRKDGTIMDVEIVTVYVNSENREYSFAFVRDITGRKIAERKIQNNTAFLNALIEQNPSSMWISDDKGFLIRMNAACRRLLHSTEAELAGKYNIFQDNIVEQQGFMPLVRSVFEEGKVVHFPLVYDSSQFSALPLKESVSLVLDVTVFPIRDADNRITRAVIIHNDVTGQEQSRRVLAESEERYRTLIDSSFDGIAIHQDGTLVFVNQTGARLLGVDDPSLLIGKRALEIVHPDDRTLIAERIRMSPEKSLDLLHERFLRADGSTLDVDVATSPCTWKGRPATYVTFRDISIQKRAQEALRESEENYRSLIELAPIAIIVHRDGKNVYANPEAVRMVKAHGPEDIIGKDILTFVNPEYHARTAESVRRISEEGVSFPRQEQSIIAVSGEELTVEIAAKPIRFQGLPSVMVLMRDITERKRVEEALFSSQQMLQTVLNTIPQRVFWKDKNSVFLGCNKSLAQDAGLSDPSELIGKTDYDNSFRETADLYRADDRQVMESGLSRINYEEPQVRPDGSKAWLRTSKVPLRDREGNVVGVLGTYEDITEYKRSQEALRESEEQYRTLVENANEAIAIVQEWRIVFVNKRGVEFLGRPVQDIEGRLFMDFVWPEDRDQLEDLHGKRIAGEPAPQMYDFRIVGSGGRPVWVSNSTTGITWKGIPAALSLMTDITERKFAEAALKESEETFRKVIEGAPEAIYISADWKFVYLNPAALRLMGATSGDQLVGTPVLDRIHPRFHDAAKNRIHGLYDEKAAASTLEEIYVRLDGTEIEVEVSAVPFEYQKKSSALVFVWNVSERKKAERERKESEEKFRHILESMQDAYIRTDRDGIVTMVNPSVVRMYGYTLPEEIIGKPAAVLYYSSAEREIVLKRLQEEKAIMDITGQGRKKDGTPFWTSLNIQFVYDSQGGIAGFEGYIRDITERKVMEQAIQDTNKKLSLLNSITRHDVANQLTVLRGYAQLVELSNTDPVIIDFMQKIEKATDTITSQIEFTKAYQELGAHTPAWFGLEEILEKTARPEVSFSKTCLETEIFADPMIERVFFNLFDNAIRHGEHVTTIGIRCERAPDGLVIIVEDDGVGIAPEEKEKIFHKAYGKNTGFGLFLAREILAITGITIRETGYLGVGARFEITVPKERWRTAAGQEPR